MSFLKKIIIFTILLTFFGCLKKNSITSLDILNDSIYIDKANVGDTISTWIMYKNVGEKDLKIEAVETSCGCTVPFFSKEPIKPNSYDSIKILFTPAYKGLNEQTVVIKSNSNKTFDIVKISCNTND